MQRTLKKKTTVEQLMHSRSCLEVVPLCLLRESSREKKMGMELTWERLKAGA